MIRAPGGSASTASDDLLGRLLLDRATALRAVRPPDPGVQQPQIVVDLGDRADGGTRVVAGALLVDRDRRREPADEIDVRLVHLAEELPGIRRERLDVAALALGVDRVEGERRLARARQAGDHDQLVARDRDVDVLQVVLAGALDDDLIECHASALSGLSSVAGDERGEQEWPWRQPQLAATPGASRPRAFRSA